MDNKDKTQQKRLNWMIPDHSFSRSNVREKHQIRQQSHETKIYTDKIIEQQSEFWMDSWEKIFDLGFLPHKFQGKSYCSNSFIVMIARPRCNDW